MLPRIVLSLLLTFSASFAWAQAKVMNPGEAIGQLVFLSEKDVLEETPKYKSLNPLSIPVFAELPMDMAVVAGAITLKQQNLLSHVQIKSRARRTPNLDISELPGGMSHESMREFKDGMWIHMVLTAEGGIHIEKSTEQAANDFWSKKKVEKITLKTDVKAREIFRSEHLSWTDFDKVGSKAANYAELMKALNTNDRMVVQPGYAIPFYYYEDFVNRNPEIKKAIQQVLADPLMRKISRVSYREEKLQKLRDLMMNPKNQFNEQLVEDLLSIFEGLRDSKDLPRKMKLRSSTNAEDLANFNGAGLYTSDSYKPLKKGAERTREEKVETLKKALRTVWASVWNLRAFEERNFFQIPHGEVRMGIQVNPSFGQELVDGVVVTKNIADDKRYTGPGVYIEAQRGDDYSVANPVPGIKPEKILVLYNTSEPLNTNAYKIIVLQKSNIADDMKTILKTENPKPIMTDGHIKDLVYQSLKATAHFKPRLGNNNPDFSLDIEFKLDAVKSGQPQIYLKQSRPFID